MILIAQRSKPFLYTVKRTVRRRIVLDSYEDEIDAAYVAIEESSQTDIQIPAQFDDSTTLEFVRGVVGKVIASTSVNLEDDIFQVGCDR